MAKILIAEDDRISQKLALKIVENLGHTGFISPNGQHAYDSLIASNDFDLLLTDIMMPEMDGQQLIKQLRKQKQFENFPIVIMSAVVGVSEISNLLKLGATWFLGKPLDSVELEGYIERSLSKAD